MHSMGVEVATVSLFREAWPKPAHTNSLEHVSVFSPTSMAGQQSLLSDDETAGTRFSFYQTWF